MHEDVRLILKHLLHVYTQMGYIMFHKINGVDVKRYFPIMSEENDLQF